MTRLGNWREITPRRGARRAPRALQRPSTAIVASGIVAAAAVITLAVTGSSGSPPGDSGTRAAPAPQSRPAPAPGTTTTTAPPEPASARPVTPTRTLVKQAGGTAPAAETYQPAPAGTPATSAASSTPPTIPSTVVIIWSDPGSPDNGSHDGSGRRHGR
ncbi:hypothetical protein [Amycolatopsis saalfeldensis]|uniref:Uncharacterized protein n=1 Tax=Amycolatopsis saalfeldensis TaxID=394193 RepID=A0A1H8YFT9_9PSEU|nr:hypothetical protein [Amycolatopsis saalfeldensis]SEP50923.1 hypothetical protein SAMN04489732_11572 [Amycolatopsis saalfeldensis]